MKRCVILMSLLVLLLCGCTAKEPKLQEPVNFYYLNTTVTYNSQSGIISPEIREGAGYKDDLVSLLNVYVNGPEGQLHISPFPDRLEVYEITTEEDTASVTLSDQVCMLTGHDLTLACVCLCRTVMDLTAAQSVQISVPDRLIDGKTAITIHAQDLVFVDGATYASSDAG